MTLPVSITLGKTVKPTIPPILRIGNSLTAQNTFSTSVNNGTAQASTGTDGVVLYGSFTFKLTGTWVATVTIQRSTDQGVTWNDVTTGISAPVVLALTTTCVLNGYEPTRDVMYRFGVKTGNYTSGTVVGEFEQ